MSNDLVAACVFCGALLFGAQPPPLFGFTGEVGGAYGTYQRQYLVAGEKAGISDVTGKSPLIGIGWSKGPKPGLGAGTPVTEVRVRLAFGSSHDQAKEPEGTPERLEASGNGRFENAAFIARVAVTERGTLEGVMAQHRHVVTDVVTLDGPFGEATARYLIAERRDISFGWRQRFPDAEVALRGEYGVLQGKLNTPGGALLSRGGIPGVGIDAALVLGNWRLSAGGDWLSGHVDRQDRYRPDFVPQTGTDPASMYGAGVRGAGRFGTVVIDLGLFAERANLPWVSLAVLGEEQRRFDNGFRPSSEATSVGVDLHLQVRAASGVYAQFLGRIARSTETVTFTDALDARPTATADVRVTPKQQFMFGLGLTFSLGRAGPGNPVP